MLLKVILNSCLSLIPCMLCYSVQRTHTTYVVLLILSSVPTACMLCHKVCPVSHAMYAVSTLLSNGPTFPTTVLVCVGFSALLHLDFYLYFWFLLPPGCLLPIQHPEPPAHYNPDPVHPTPVILQALLVLSLCHEFKVMKQQAACLACVRRGCIPSTVQTRRG